MSGVTFHLLALAVGLVVLAALAGAFVAILTMFGQHAPIIIGALVVGYPLGRLTMLLTGTSDR